MTSLHIKRMTFPEYKYYATRLASYGDLTRPTPLLKKAHSLAEAGFFHTGKRDETICYYCGGGLKDWEDSDDAWENHAKWFSKCPYVLVMRGKEFVDSCCGRKAKKLIVNVTKCVAKDKVSDDMKCLICITGKRCVLFLPCGHCCVCEVCSLQVESCIYCRTGSGRSGERPHIFQDDILDESLSSWPANGSHRPSVMESTDNRLVFCGIVIRNKTDAEAFSRHIEDMLSKGYVLEVESTAVSTDQSKRIDSQLELPMDDSQQRIGEDTVDLTVDAEEETQPQCVEEDIVDLTEN